MHFIAFKNPSSSAGFDPANLGFSDKRDNHYINEYEKPGDGLIIRPASLCRDKSSKLGSVHKYHIMEGLYVKRM
jgi:hypothetical protein